MKFGTTWKNLVSQLPNELAPYTVSYPRWKKAKTLPTMDELAKDCEQASNVLVSRIPWQKKSLPWSCFDASLCSKSPSAQELYQFACINKITLYKLCKRLKKRGIAPDAMNWLSQMQSTLAFNFLGSFLLTRLELESSLSFVPDCPICFESCKDTPLFILDCGHSMCVPCLMSYTCANRMKGIMCNVLAASVVKNRKPCPICRYPSPMQAITQEHVWPQDNDVLRQFIPKTTN